MIDAHCHLNFQAFEKDYDEVIKNAEKAGITAIINAGTQVRSSQWAVDLADKYKNLYAVIAIHPHHADKVINSSTKNDQDDWLKQLEQLAKHPKVVGIGECGLDYFHYQSNGIVDPSIQKKVFIQQLALAYKLKLPLQIHSRTEEARKEIIDILKGNKDLLRDNPGMFHCTAGSIESLREILELNFAVGFDGNVTYDGPPPGEPLELKELVAFTPLEQIVIETDSPYLTPLPSRGKRNEPQYAIITAHFLARLKKVSFEALVEQTDKNVYTIFGL
jgi:TatD DNase family protein